MKTKIQTCLTFFLLALGVSAHADILELKNGNVLNGKYAGGSAGTVRFDTGCGREVVEPSQAVALTFTTPPEGPTASSPTPAPPPTEAAGSATLPTGTILL